MWHSSLILWLHMSNESENRRGRWMLHSRAWKRQEQPAQRPGQPHSVTNCPCSFLKCWHQQQWPVRPSYLACGWQCPRQQQKRISYSSEDKILRYRYITICHWYHDIQYHMIYCAITIRMLNKKKSMTTPTYTEITDIRLRPWCCPAVSHLKYMHCWHHFCLANYGQTWCHTPEVRNVTVYCHQRRTKPQPPWFTCTCDVWTCDLWDMRADRHTHRHAHRNTSHPCQRGWVKMHSETINNRI